ncbi:MAG: translation elongation factor 4 [Patescibacteria group bacterium]|nr:translation elongation factor 4 [Patescibacteria group bacterium]
MEQTRNFSIIAHIDHGKSTLADRFLELTGTIEKRKMREQVLDSMELERERGITIKMQPVAMHWRRQEKEYRLNLIDTPGHIDFSYEVSRALSAVEGAILLVDATQGVQAQTLTTLSAAQELGLTIIPAVSKIDSPLARVREVKEELGKLLDIDPQDVYGCSGRTGEGVEKLLEAVIEKIPPPRAAQSATTQGLIFDFQYSDHQGVIVYLRLFGGSIRKGSKLQFAASERTFTALEVGVFSPAPKPIEALDAGSIGYIVTGIKESGFARVGDTVRSFPPKAPALPGYAEPKPVVWASLYPESQDDFPKLRSALGRLRLSDAAFSFEEESSGMLGRGFRCGFLGMLHLEIIAERLRREFSLALVITTPTITYEVETKDGKHHSIFSPSLFPEYGDIVKVWEPYVEARIVVPSERLGSVTQVLFEHEGVVEVTEIFSEGRMIVHAAMPLRELMRNFFDKIKTVSSGYASVSYEMRDLKEADVARLDVLVAEELIPAFSRIVAKHRAYEEAQSAVEKLYTILPRQQFATKIQGAALGRILSSRTLPALRKDVTGYLYGGDYTRKMKLWEKQKRGKKKLKERGRVNIPEEVFMKMVKGE